MKVSIEEVAMLLGQKDIEIFLLQKQSADLSKRIQELTQNPPIEVPQA